MYVIAIEQSLFCGAVCHTIISEFSVAVVSVTKCPDPIVTHATGAMSQTGALVDSARQSTRYGTF